MTASAPISAAAPAMGDRGRGDYPSTPVAETVRQPAAPPRDVHPGPRERCPGGAHHARRPDRRRAHHDGAAGRRGSCPGRGHAEFGRGVFDGRTARVGRRLSLVLVAAFLALVLGSLVAPLAALAHPLGNFTVNQYSRLEIEPGGIRVVYALDMAELPTVQDRALLDADGDGVVANAERSAYLDARLADIAPALRLEIDGAAVPLRLVNRSLAFPPGQAGLPTTRIEAVLEASAPALADGARISFANGHAVDRLGWREIVTTHSAGIALAGDASPVDRSDELRAYPQDLLAAPPDERAVDLSFALAPGAPAVARQVGSGEPSPSMTAAGRASDPVAALAAVDAGVAGGLLALLLAAGWGAVHALSPGHGKTLVGAYLVGSRGTPRHALFLGLTVTITHTAGVLALGVLVVAASRAVAPERIYPWLAVMSGVLVAALGASMLAARLRGRHAFGHHHHHGHDHSHAHEQADDHLHTHGAGHDHDHHHAHFHGDDAGHAQPHSHDGHPHGDSHHTHVHPHDHSHLPPGADGGAITWRSLLALGVSGGLVPCPSALLALLGAVAVGRAGFGVLVVLAFSAGLAATLSAVGLAFLYAGRLLESRVRPGGRFRFLAPILRWAPVGGAAAVTIAGLLILARALQEIRIL